MKTSYSKTEFEGNDKTLQGFFKHIDQQTSESNSSRVDFFSFYGIDKRLIKDEGEWKYSIPAESAQLLTGLIKAFSSAYRKDQRGRKKGSPLPYGYESYHDYISKLFKAVDCLEPYQQALIKTHMSYYNAKIIDAFIPGIMERIEILLMLLFCYGDEHDCDTFTITMEQLEKILEGLMQRKHKDSQHLKARGEHRKLFTFEDAISDVFQMLTDKEYRVDDKNSHSITDPNLVKTLLNALQKEREAVSQITENVDDYRQELSKRLNDAYSEYLKHNCNNIAIRDDNVQFELTRAQKFWDTKSQSERIFLNLLDKYKDRVYEAIEMAMRYCGPEISVDRLRHAIEGRALEGLRTDNWDEVKDACHDMEVYQFCEEELTAIEERKPTTMEELEKIVDDCAWVSHQRVEEEMKFQSQSHQDDYRVLLCDYYRNIKKDWRYKEIDDALMRAISVMIPTKLVSKRNQTIQSIK